MCRPLPGVKTTIGVPVAPTRADIRAAVPARRLGHGDLATGLDPGQELFVRGGVIEQHRHPGVEVRGAPVGDGELEHVTAPKYSARSVAIIALSASSAPTASA